MTYSRRIFDNPNQLRKDVIKRRITPLDSEAVVELYIVDVLNENREKIGNAYYVGIDSFLPDNTIEAGLSIPTTAEELVAIGRNTQARQTAKEIPFWAKWTQAEWAAYFGANLSDTEANKVTSLATAVIMIKRQNLVIDKLTQMVFAMRDELWPDL